MEMTIGTEEKLDPLEIAKASWIVSLLKRRWTVHIMYMMLSGPVRLSELMRELPTASKKALTSSLRSLEAAKVVSRIDLSDSVLHVEYDYRQGMREHVACLLHHLVNCGEFNEP